VGVRVRCIPTLLALAGLGVAGCGGASSHARVAPRTCRRGVPYRVRSAQLNLTRRASTSAQVRDVGPVAWFPAPGSSTCRFPLIMFSPGSGLRPTNYVPLLTHLAPEGFVVVGVRHIDRGAQGDEAAERVADVTYVLDHVGTIARRLAPGLPAELDASRVGTAGHSFGAFVAAQEAVSDPRIDAALTMAGPPRPGNARATRVPVLSIAGGADTAVPARLVRAYYDQLPARVPHGFLQIAGATHAAYGNHCAAQRTCAIVQSYATSFFLRYLDGLRSAGRPLDPRAPRSSRVQLRTVGMP
jgi:predicted dienelactone hydrolase